MWSEHVITLPTLAFTYDHACTQTVLHAHVVDMQPPPPTNARHVRFMFVQLTWCEVRGHQFPIEIYMLDVVIILSICDVSSMMQSI